MSLRSGVVEDAWREYHKKKTIDIKIHYWIINNFEEEIAVALWDVECPWKCLYIFSVYEQNVWLRQTYTYTLLLVIVPLYYDCCLAADIGCVLYYYNKPFNIHASLNLASWVL